MSDSNTGILNTASKKHFWFVQKDGGFSGVGVIIALSLTIALLVTSAQVYWTNSVSGDVQFAADAGALAAENVVAEYYVVARIADAVVLSFSLFGIIVFGVAIVVSCIPYCQSVGAKIMEFGHKVFKARDNIANKAQEMLTKLQKVLPYLAAVNAASVISSNSFSSSGQARYMGLAILVPWTGEESEFSDDAGAEDAAKNAEEKNEQTGAKTEEAEQFKKEMDQAKHDAYMSDCGNNPGYCMYERANHLANLGAAQNPHFASAEFWEFNYALDRAKSYYHKRAQIETPAHGGLAERINSKVRKRFYEYAAQTMESGYARVDSDGVLDAYFPLVARNPEEVRRTALYTDAMFPVDSDNIMHGVSDCAEFSGDVSAWGSISDLESDYYESCSVCNLGISTIGNVASATTNFETGFEHHYRKVAEAATRYAEASKKHKDAEDAAKGSADAALGDFKAALEALKAKRLNPEPPGRNGCIAIAFDLAEREVPTYFGSGVVGGKKILAPRMAISAAALVEDSASEGNTILSSFLDRAKENSVDSKLINAGLGVFDGILGLWGDLLLAYTEGTEALIKGVESFLGSIPIIKDTPLASWASNTLEETLETFGLQGVELSAPKPVVVNTIHVVNASDSKALKAIRTAKELYSSTPGSGSGRLYDGLLDTLIVEVEGRVDEALAKEYTLFTISFDDIAGAPSIPIKVKLPPELADTSKSFIHDRLSDVKGFLGGGGPSGVWE